MFASNVPFPLQFSGNVAPVLHVIQTFNARGSERPRHCQHFSYQNRPQGKGKAPEECIDQRASKNNAKGNFHWIGTMIYVYQEFLAY